MPKPHSMSQSDASRIQSTQAKGGGDMSSKGFAAHAQSAGDRNANTGSAGSGGTTSGSGHTGSSHGGGGQEQQQQTKK
ncbi:MAG: hypothetical protein M1834_003517 [Cirrosporium novae-zelandiae]|nr:MAG: hypothetical protein M1834_003517 [Cirrosporium novae-zelandiae]